MISQPIDSTYHQQQQYASQLKIDLGLVVTAKILSWIEHTLLQTDRSYVP